MPNRMAKGTASGGGLPTRSVNFSSGLGEQNVFSAIPPLAPLASFQPFSSSFDQESQKFE